VPSSGPKTKKLQLCQKEECVEYNTFNEHQRIGMERKLIRIAKTSSVENNEIQPSRLMKLTGPTLYRQYGSFVVSRGFGAPIQQVGYCDRSSHGKVDAEVDGTRNWYTFTPILKMKMEDTCPSSGKMKLWSHDDTKILCYQKRWKSIQLNCPTCFNEE
jgi:hypothetical protein